MKVRVTLRSSSAFWASPFALGLTLFYYFVAGSSVSTDSLGYAPMIVGDALGPMYALAYAVASGLAAWESGRLRAGGIWILAPARSRFSIAAQALIPVIGLSWMMLLLPVTIALAENGVLPTFGSARPLCLALALCMAHAIIGFGVGFRLPRQVSAPIMAVVTFVAVAFSVATEPFWVRHVSGEFSGSLQFGELVSYGSIWPHLLLTGSVALSIGLLWIPQKQIFLRIVLACVVTVVGTESARGLVENWGPIAPVASGKVAMSCLGEAPRVCMPSVTSDDLSKVRTDAVSVLGDFRRAGVRYAPEVVTDRLADGRSYRPSTARTWRAQLTLAAEKGNIRLEIMKSAVRFSCSSPDPAASRAVGLWAATVIGEEEAYERQLAQRAEQFDSDPSNRAEIRSEVEDVLDKPVRKQAVWFKQRLTEACDAK